jgi:altronate dehydratase large subunit
MPELSTIFERTWTGYLRPDGKKGVRNLVLVIYTVECAKHVAYKIAEGEPDDVHVLGFSGCYDNQYAINLMLSMVRHPNVGAVLAVGLGCEFTQPEKIAEVGVTAGRRSRWLKIQETGGTRKSIEEGKRIVEEMRGYLFSETPRVEMGLADLTVGAECGGSDSTSGLAANPCVGRMFDFVVDAGGTAIWEETVEMLGLKKILVERAACESAATAIAEAYDKAEQYCRDVRQYSIAPGNFAGGLTTIEEKSLGSYAKSGSKPIQGVIKVSERPDTPGLWLLDSVPDPHFVQFGYTNPNDNEGLMDLISAGSQILIYTTGRGSCTGSVVSPVVKVTGNSATYRKLPEDMDFDAGPIMRGEKSLDEAAADLLNLVCDIASGRQSKPEALGHREYFVMFKHQDTPSLEAGCRV